MVPIAADGSLAPVDIAKSSDGLLELVFLINSEEPESASLAPIASALARTESAPFSDLEACRRAMERCGAGSAQTFVDRYCRLTALLNAVGSERETTWGRKDVQRQLYRMAGVSHTRSRRLHSAECLLGFIAAEGLPVVVKPVDGVASRELWILRNENDVREILQSRSRPENFAGMFAETFIMGQPPHAPYLGDYYSAEVFRDRSGNPFISVLSDRIAPREPANREAGVIFPTHLDNTEAAVLLRTADAAVDALGEHHGAFHVEVKQGVPQPDVIEVNGRLGGFVHRLVLAGTGVDMGRMALLAGLGRAADVRLDWRRCVALLMFQPPVDALRIEAGPNRRELMDLPGVFSVDRLVSHGAVVDGRGENGGALARVWLTADDHDMLHRRVGRVVETLDERFVLVDRNGRRVCDTRWTQQISRHQYKECE
ncbi:ATP-grasp domain-containing protein [Actinoplanes sp. Pm04-4]|uniref:ATP-grasp domain-containing protein n=1 Tax=Paractinoplanes pyxinae TaxID=2997416 RepID=A0ABT4BC47_9ACTN|nr:ATP-grasp domain-containing protein [Actinoplanes pyxinae]MCY1144086.1 ATP-grasp domain-containing protein [Actinoplanes pyxinae]